MGVGAPRMDGPPAFWPGEGTLDSLHAFSENVPAPSITWGSGRRAWAHGRPPRVQAGRGKPGTAPAIAVKSKFDGVCVCVCVCVCCVCVVCVCVCVHFFFFESDSTRDENVPARAPKAYSEENRG